MKIGYFEHVMLVSHLSANHAQRLKPLNCRCKHNKAFFPKRYFTSLCNETTSKFILSLIPMVSIARLSVVKQSSFDLPGQYGRPVTRVNCWKSSSNLLPHENKRSGRAKKKVQTIPFFIPAFFSASVHFLPTHTNIPLLPQSRIKQSYKKHISFSSH